MINLIYASTSTRLYSLKSIYSYNTKIMQSPQIQIPFKAIPAFHTLHLQQDEVSLALHIMPATIMKTHQHVCKEAAYKNLILPPLMLEAGWRMQEQIYNKGL